MIAGKGHEQGQEFEHGRKLPFDDVAVAREAMRARPGARATLLWHMRRWDAHRLASAQRAGCLPAVLSKRRSGPERTTIDSRDAGPGALFVGLPGERVHGGSFGAGRVAAGAWGVLTTPRACAGDACRLDRLGQAHPGRRSWPRAIRSTHSSVWPPPGAASSAREVIGDHRLDRQDLDQGSARGVLSPHRLTVASQANFNTEIGLPLEILAAPAGTEVLVLEMAMRGPGQIAELARIAEPDVGVIVSIGPVHLELLGTIEAIAAAKAELIAGLPAGGTAVVPADEPLLEPHRRADLPR